ncbi:MAG: ATP-binding protein [Meiothermus sp.]|nr:ATP-binding protein [Meiothermus sp.]
MKLVVRLALAFALVAVFAAGLTGWLGYREARGHFQRFVAGGEAARSGETPQAGVPGRGRQILLAQLQASSWRSSLLALAVALGVGTYLAFRLVQPVQTLTQATRRFGRGERGVRVNIPGRDELAELGRAFNDVAAELTAKEQRERQMIADIAHELRTPLTILKGDLESMSDGLLEASSENLRRLVGEVDLLTRLVQDLRTLSLSDTGQLVLRPRLIALNRLVEDVLANFQPRAEAAGVELQATLRPLSTHADPERLQQVLLNLLENALRHTPKGGQIAIILDSEGENAVLEVCDTGPGVAPEHLPHLFERFYRAEPSRARESGGTGLGLAIVKALIEAHGGRVAADNRPEGGARFWIHLPLSSPSEPEQGGAD